MKRFFALFAALTLFCTGISAQTAACRTETGIAYRDAAGDGYVDSLCRLDICWPADRKGFPTVVWFHGGGLTGGRREIPKALCGKGFAVVGVDYRLAPRVNVYVRENAVIPIYPEEVNCTDEMDLSKSIALRIDHNYKGFWTK